MSSARGLVIETKHLEFDESENTYINRHNATHNMVNIISIQKPHSQLSDNLWDPPGLGVTIGQSRCDYSTQQAFL